MNTMSLRSSALVLAGACAIFVFPLAVGLFSQEEPVKVECSIRPLRPARGEEGQVVLKMSVKKGFSISPLPALIIEFDNGEDLVFPKNFFTASDLNIEVLEENGEEFLNLNKPILIPFTVSPKAKRGIHALAGRVKYFARSRKEGWCLKRSSRFSATYYTRIWPAKKQS